MGTFQTKQKEILSNIISLGSAAIGATTGKSTDVVSSSVAGTTAVEDNGLTPEQIKLRSIDIASCKGEALCEFQKTIKWDMISRNQDMKSIGNGISNIYNGLNNGITGMWENSPWYAKGTLITAGGIVALPVAEVVGGKVINDAYTNPEKVLLGYESADIANDIWNDSMPPSTKTAQAYNFIFQFDDFSNNIKLLYNDIKKSLK